MLGTLSSLTEPVWQGRLSDLAAERTAHDSWFVYREGYSVQTGSGAHRSTCSVYTGNDHTLSSCTEVKKESVYSTCAFIASIQTTLLYSGKDYALSPQPQSIYT
jgi:hypothetical protein